MAHPGRGCCSCRLLWDRLTNQDKRDVKTTCRIPRGSKFVRRQMRIGNRKRLVIRVPREHQGEGLGRADAKGNALQAGRPDGESQSMTRTLQEAGRLHRTTHEIVSRRGVPEESTQHRRSCRGFCIGWPPRDAQAVCPQIPRDPRSFARPSECGRTRALRDRVGSWPS
jgi:hypothetical protein